VPNPTDQCHWRCQGATRGLDRPNQYGLETDVYGWSARVTLTLFFPMAKFFRRARAVLALRSEGWFSFCWYFVFFLKFFPPFSRHLISFLCLVQPADPDTVLVPFSCLHCARLCFFFSAFSPLPPHSSPHTRGWLTAIATLWVPRVKGIHHFNQPDGDFPPTVFGGCFVPYHTGRPMPAP